MAIFTDNYDEVIKSLQSAEELSDIRFVHAFEAKKTSRPIKSPFCAVDIKNTYTYSQTYSYETFLLKVYAPLSQNGSKCHDYVHRIGEYLIKNLKGVVSIASTGIDYNVNAMAFTSELTVKCRSEDVLKLEEDEDTYAPVTIDGTTFDAKYITAYVNNSYHAIREMWNSNPIGFVPGDEIIVIEIKFFDKHYLDLVEDMGNFTLQFDNTTYTGCYFTDIEYDYVRNVVNKAQLYAKRKRQVYG